MQELDAPDEPAANIEEGVPERIDDDPERGDPLAPGDSDLADAWWAV